MAVLENNLDQSSMVVPDAGISVVEGAHTARLVNPARLDEVCAFQRLRYDYYVVRRRWIVPDLDSPGRETDRYDPYAWHLAVFRNESGHASIHAVQMVAYLRVIPWTAPSGFMLGDEFACLTSPDELSNVPDSGSVELSRLVIAPAAGAPGNHQNDSRGNPHHVIEILLKLLYHLSLKQQIEHYYIVVEASWLKMFTRRFHLPFRTIGHPHTFPDGTETIAAYTTRAALEEAVLSQNPDKYFWYLRHCADER